MNRTVVSPRRHPRSRVRSFCRAALVLLLLSVLFAGIGCGKNGPKSIVSGKVTLKGQPVGGIVTFVGEGNKEGVAPIAPDGTYTMNDPPQGAVKVAVKGAPTMSGMQRPMPAPKDKANDPTRISMGVPPPMKYASPGNGLTFNVTGGPQTYDIELKP